MNRLQKNKIASLNTLSRLIKKEKSLGKKIVLCHGAFDLIHAGHIRHLHSAKKYGDILVVSITADHFVKKGPGRPAFNEKLRAEVLASIAAIDYVVVINDYSAIPIIETIHPDIYVKGPDYQNRKSNIHIPQKLEEEQSRLESYGGKIVFTDDIVFSSSHLLNQYLDSYPKKTQQYLKILRRTYSGERIIDLLSRIKKVRVLIIGESIIDQYCYCSPLGKSTKEPIVVNRYLKEESFAGGTLATANHVTALSDHVKLVSVLGKQKSFERFIRKNLKNNIVPRFYYDSKNQTIVKRRFIDLQTQHKIFQISYINNALLPEKTEAQVVSFLQRTIPDFDMIIVNDYGHGMLTQKIINAICKHARFLAINVQANSANYGFNVVTKYPHADFVCIDEYELRLATHDKYNQLKNLIKQIAQTLSCKKIVVTRGLSGAISYSKYKGFKTSPALSLNVVDRVGAGDAFFAIASLSAYSGMDQTLVSFMGNVAGALKVAHIGNKVQIEFDDLVKFITRLLK